MLSYMLVSQLSHFFAGTTIVLACDKFLHSWLIGLAVTLAWALAKEFTYDIFVEGDTVINGVIDTAVYMIGALVAANFCNLWEN